MILRITIELIDKIYWIKNYQKLTGKIIIVILSSYYSKIYKIFLFSSRIIFGKDFLNFKLNYG